MMNRAMRVRVSGPLPRYANGFRTVLEVVSFFVEFEVAVPHLRPA